MFTGIITDIAEVKHSDKKENGLKLTFKKPNGWKDLELGDSISTNGACLTVTKIDDDSYECFLIPETLAKTTFGRRVPDKVNLERALKADGRIDGNFVLGHVDEVGEVISFSKDNDWVMLVIACSKEFQGLVVYKGSVVINGVALTISKATIGSFEVSLIPYTLDHTTLGLLNNGDSVNIEYDILGKYVLNNLANK
jgi:riboflavin synthase